MSLKNATELSVLLVKEIYGEISAKVINILLQHGRLPFAHILGNAKLPGKTVKETLVVLIQQHLVLHYTQREAAREVTYYEANWKQIYHLLHAGRAIRWTEERYGADAAVIISNFLQLGHARVGDFLSAYGSNFARQSKSNATVNGFDGTEAIASPDTLREKLEELVKAKILIPVRAHHMQPAADLHNEIKQKMRKELLEQTTVESKITKTIEAEWRARLRELDEAPIPVTAGVKRKEAPTETKAPAKRRKQAQTSYTTTVVTTQTVGVDDSVALRVNYDKFLVLFRNQELVALAEKRIGKVTSQVYEELLKAMESKIHKCRVDDDIAEDEYKKYKVSTLEVFKNFPDTIKLEDSISPPPKGKASGSKKRKRKHDDSDDENEDDSDEKDSDDDDSDGFDDSDEDGGGDGAARKKKMTLIKNHLELLSQGSVKFVKFESSKGMGEWSVDFKELAAFLRQNEVEKIVYERFGKEATRLIRIVDEKGKLDEKQLANLALIRQKDIRAKLLCLHDAGHLSIQEIAKTAERHPARTIYLWFYDRAKAQSHVLHEIYKGMSRAIQRLEKEREDRASLLAKVNRTDVLGNEDQLLTKMEKTEATRWKEIELHMWAQIGRMDRQIMILRDF